MTVCAMRHFDLQLLFCSGKYLIKELEQVKQ